MPWSAVAGAYWARSAHLAEDAEKRLSAWAARVVWLYAAFFIFSITAMVASLPSLVHYFRLVFDHPGTPVTVQPVAYQVIGDIGLPIEVVVAVVFLVWQYRAATTARVLGYPARRSPGLGVGSWFIPVVNLWFPYQALRDLLPLGHPLRPLALRTWLSYLLMGILAGASELIAFTSIPAGVAIGMVAIIGWIFIGTWAYRLVNAVSANHAEAVSRF
jgi:hypothetical protein